MSTRSGSNYYAPEKLDSLCSPPLPFSKCRVLGNWEVHSSWFTVCAEWGWMSSWMSSWILHEVFTPSRRLCRPLAGGGDDLTAALRVPPTAADVCCGPSDDDERSRLARLINDLHLDTLAHTLFSGMRG